MPAAPVGLHVAKVRRIQSLFGELPWYRSGAHAPPNSDFPIVGRPGLILAQRRDLFGSSVANGAVRFTLDNGRSNDRFRGTMNFC